MTASVLVADCVSKSFGARRVLSAGSLRAHPGQVRVLFGRNGIGKSTLLKIAAGVIAADSGTVHINGRALLRPSLPQLAMAGVFYLPDHELLSPAFTLGEQLRFFERRFGVRSAREAARLARVEDHLAQRPQELSGGELRGMAAAGCAVVVTGHEVQSLLALADHITWCTSGTTYELGTPAQALSHEAFLREYGMHMRA